MKKENVVKPEHYQGMYQGTTIEAIDVIEAFDLAFNLGNALKYIVRAGKKGDKIEDLHKASYYISREILKLEGM